MKLANETHNSLSRIRAFAVFFAVMLMFATFANAQSPQLSLADLLIGLRSKKVSLPERNAILTEAVRQRGVTFAMTPEMVMSGSPVAARRPVRRATARARARARGRTKILMRTERVSGRARTCQGPRPAMR